jgi:hypothetical protein
MAKRSRGSAAARECSPSKGITPGIAVALLRLGDRTSTGLGASTRFFAALGATSAPGADYCFDQIVSKERAST